MLQFKNNKEVCINPAIFTQIQKAMLCVLSENKEKQSPLENPLQQMTEYRKTA